MSATAYIADEHYNDVKTYNDGRDVREWCMVVCFCVYRRDYSRILATTIIFYKFASLSLTRANEPTIASWTCVRSVTDNRHDVDEMWLFWFVETDCLLRRLVPIYSYFSPFGLPIPSGPCCGLIRFFRVIFCYLSGLTSSTAVTR